MYLTFLAIDFILKINSADEISGDRQVIVETLPDHLADFNCNKAKTSSFIQ